MTNTEISNNNPEKASIEDKSISDDKPKEIRTFTFKNWISWKFFFPIIPGIFYFRETSSPHLLPILFNPKQLKDELLKKVESMEIKNS